MRQLLKNARIYDGTGSEPYVSDILVEDDRIVQIETINGHQGHDLRPSSAKTAAKK